MASYPAPDNQQHEGVTQYTTPKTEYLDSADDYKLKIAHLIKLMQSSSSTVIFTGAGISTAASIPDIRGDHGLETNKTPIVVLGLKEQDMDCIMPTYSHCAIVELINRGIVEFVATSNHDGLHQKAGLMDTCIADVFGNVFVEQCLKCGRMYKRSVIVPSLGRKCDDQACLGRLQKTGTRMGAMTPEEPLSRANIISKKSELAIVLGSSLTVSPFCEIPFLCKNVVICNLQDTNYDSKAVESIHANCDDVMRDICKAYKIEFNKFTFSHQFNLIIDFNGELVNLKIQGNKVNEPSGVVLSVNAWLENDKNNFISFNKNMKDEFLAEIQHNSSASQIANKIINIEFHFRENFNSPPHVAFYEIKEGKHEYNVHFEKTVYFN